MKYTCLQPRRQELTDSARLVHHILLKPAAVARPPIAADSQPLVPEHCSSTRRRSRVPRRSEARIAHCKPYCPHKTDCTGRAHRGFSGLIAQWRLYHLILYSPVLRASQDDANVCLIRLPNKQQTANRAQQSDVPPLHHARR